MLAFRLCFLMSVVSLASLDAASVTYPSTRTVNQVDAYHGISVRDPYRWLEEVDSEETVAWVNAQRAVTESFLRTIPERGTIRARLDALTNIPRSGIPVKQGGRYFSSHNTGLQNQPTLRMRTTLDAAPTVVLDPNQLASDGTVALTAYAGSPDGRWLAYALSRSGSDWNEYRIKDLITGEDTADTLRWVKFSRMSWTHDSAGFFYSRYPTPPDTGDPLFRSLENQRIYYHRRGTPQSEDVLVYARPDQPKWGLGGGLTEDGRYLIIRLSEGTDPRNRLHVLDLKDPEQPQFAQPPLALIDTLEASFSVIGNDGPVLFLRTDLDAPRSRIIAIDLRAPERGNWKTLVAETNDTMASATLVGDRLVVEYMRDARSILRRFTQDGADLGEIALPGIGQVGGLSGREDESELFFSYSSFNQPSTIFRTDVVTGETRVFEQPALAFDPSLYETRQVFYASKDGTRIPMFITARRDLPRDRPHPTLLYGYGGFNISLSPSYSASTIAWLEQGGVYAVANLRGGGEYGREWHAAGTKLRKQNVFDDFIAAGEYLIREGYTSSAKLTLSGRSNGGLLVGAVVNQRPDLARVALPGVGVMDMMRFHRFTIGWAWRSDYGSADDNADMASYLHGYSPLHTVRQGAAYPAVLVTTGDHDDRVHPGHSFKYAAALQAANSTNALPLLIRIDAKAGHGAGKPIGKLLDETADTLAFALHFTR
jgi:prolyl oligopeptidase